MSEALSAALRWVKRWHDEDPVRRRMLEPSDVRSLRVLDPVQIRLETRTEERVFHFTRLGVATGAIEERPSDPWRYELPDFDADDVVTEVAQVVLACGTCSGDGVQRCRACRGQGQIDIDLCHRCGGEGKEPCVDCQGSGRLLHGVDVRRSLHTETLVRVFEDEGDELGPLALLYLVDHATPGEVIHEQTAPRIGRYRGQGSGGDYRSAATPLATAVDALLARPSDGRGRPVEQTLTLTRVPVYALELRRKTVYVYGDPPQVSPPLRAWWLSLLPVGLATLLLLGLATLFFWFVSGGRGG